MKRSPMQLSTAASFMVLDLVSARETRPSASMMKCSTTLRREAKQRGLEPDECYKLGKLEEDGVPDIAIEVIVSSSLVDKMAVYAGLAVPEVWEWNPESGIVAVHRLVSGRYERVDRSAIVPSLDLAQLSRFVRPGENQTRLAKEYQAALR